MSRILQKHSKAVEYSSPDQLSNVFQRKRSPTGQFVRTDSSASCHCAPCAKRLNPPSESRRFWNELASRRFQQQEKVMTREIGDLPLSLKRRRISYPRRAASFRADCLAVMTHRWRRCPNPRRGSTQARCLSRQELGQMSSNAFRRLPWIRRVHWLGFPRSGRD